MHTEICSEKIFRKVSEDEKAFEILLKLLLTVNACNIFESTLNYKSYVPQERPGFF